jgi:hypothetical protein
VHHGREEVSQMAAELVQRVVTDECLLRPAYWLVFALPWPGGDTAEAVLAVAPGGIPRQALRNDAFQVLVVADQYARGRAKSVIFFSELSRGLSRAGNTWADYGIDWERALAELESYPALFMTISERAYSVICNPEAQPSQEAEGDRDLVRAALAMKLGEDWAPYMQGVIDAAGRGGRDD